jgi:hypothetical protein
LDKVAWAEKKAKQVRYDALQTKHGALPISSWVACNANDSTLYEQTFGEVAA